MFRKINIAAAVLVLLALLALGGCRSSRGTATRVYAPTLDAKTVITLLADTYGNWDDVSAPLRLQLAGPKEVGVSTTAKMRRGECISISARVLGFEVASLYADKDSLIVYAKTMDMYYAESLAELQRSYGIGIADIQSLMLGRLFLPGKGVLSRDEASSLLAEPGGEAGTYMLAPRRQSDALNFTYGVAVMDNRPVLDAMTVLHQGIEPLCCAFSKAADTEVGAVAPAFAITTAVKGNEVGLTGEWNLDRAKWNSGVSIQKPKISRKARRVDTATLLNMLKKL